MPQLDKVHFLSQFFWLCLSFFGFYFFIVKYFLPSMARILQWRKNKLAAATESSNGGELHSVQESGEAALENLFSLCHKFLSQNEKRAADWYEKEARGLNRNYFHPSNNSYVKKLGDLSLAQNAALEGALLAKPAGCYAWFLTNTLRESGKRKRA